MLSEDKEKKLIEIFIAIDDFCLQLDGWKQSKPEQFATNQLEKPLMSESEMMSICVLFLQYNTRQSQRTGIYFIDSKQLPVCHNRRIHSHRVFDSIARRGKCSTGWFTV